MIHKAIASCLAVLERSAAVRWRIALPLSNSIFIHFMYLIVTNASERYPVWVSFQEFLESMVTSNYAH